MRKLGYLPLLFAVACSAQSSDENCDNCDETATFDTVRSPLDDSQVPAAPCDGVLVDRSGRLNADGSPIRHVAGRLGDPFAKAIFGAKGSSCPTTTTDVMTQFIDNRNSSCEGLSHSTQVVSETANTLGPDKASYRAVTSARCENESFGGTLFSLFGGELSPNTSAVPEQGLEIISFDVTAGVFNYYKEVGGVVQYFGNSIDYVEEGAGGPGLTDVRGCANCHTSGGLVMKELQSPWLHWEGGPSDGVDGAQALVDNRKTLFGSRRGGLTMENLVQSTNRVWSKAKMHHLARTGQVKELLRPLFCPAQVNIRSGNKTTLGSGPLNDSMFGFG